jgi:HlyD family secretion protein
MTPRRPRSRVRFFAGLLATLIVLSAGSFGVYRWQKAQAAASLPVAPARKGDFLVIIRCRGEIRARRSVQVFAPVNVPDLRIIWLAPTGGQVKEGEPIIRFDPSSAARQLQEKQAALKQAQATLDQAVAQARITVEQDRRDQAGAQYDVELAEMEASKQVIVDFIKGEGSKIDLALAQRQLRVKAAGAALHDAASEAKLASLTRVRDQAQSDVELVKSRMAKLEITTPVSGVIVFGTNYSQGYMNAQPFKLGDQVWAGASLAEIPDLDTLEMEAKIEEIDRGRIAGGNDVRIRVDSLPELTFNARLSQISALTQIAWEWPITATFRASARLEKPDPRLRPGMNGSMDMVISRLKDAISIPARALFTVGGKPMVYLAENQRYRPVEVKVIARNPDEVAIEGVAAGAKVALTEPQSKESKK